MGTVKDDLAQSFRQSQEKYVYYILVLNVTALGFALNQSSHSSLNWSHILLGIALLCWLFSIYCGLEFLKIVLNVLHNNYNYLAIKQLDKEHGSNVDDELFNSKLKELEADAEMGKRKFNQMNISFYLGIIIYITFHLAEMYFRRN